jgi:hypothetical protein
MDGYMVVAHMSALYVCLALLSTCRDAVMIMIRRGAPHVCTRVVQTNFNR